MQHVEVSRRFAAPPERVWEVYTDHAGWQEWAGIGSSSLDVEGQPDRNGTGAVRALGSGGLNAYEGQLTSTIEMSPIVTEMGPRTGDGGIDFLRFKAMRMVSDENAVGYGGGTSDVIVGINPKWLKIYIHRDADFSPTELVKVDKQTAYVGQIRFHGQLVPLQLRRHFVLFNI